MGQSDPPADRDEARLAQRQLNKDLFISFLAVVSVAIGLYDLARPRTSTDWRWYDFLDLAIVLIFIVDFIVSARRSGDARRYMRKHWWEIPALIPITGNIAYAEAVPLIRGLRLVRVARVLRLLRLVGTAGRLEDFWRRALKVARRANLGKLAVFALVMIAAGTGLGWLFESPYNERMADPATAFWWAFNLFTNVAYVDFQPRTGAGRAIAGVLEIAGIAFIGLFTASLANALLREEEPETPGEDAPLD